MICKKEVLDIYVSGRGSAIILVGVCQEKAGEIEKNPNAECNESGNQIARGCTTPSCIPFQRLCFTVRKINAPTFEGWLRWGDCTEWCNDSTLHSEKSS